MRDNTPIPAVTKARSKLARLHSGNPNPDPVALAEARVSLAVSKLDREVRDTLTGVRLDDVYAAHLVGLILGFSGVQYDAVTVIEQAVRDAVTAVQGGAQ